MAWRSRWLIALSPFFAAGPAIGEPTTARHADTDSQSIAPWLHRIGDKVQAQFSAPAGAPADVSATLEVWLLTNGRVWSMRLVRTSGYAPYELAARRAIASAEPLPAPEEPATFERMRIVTLEFEQGSVRAARGEPKRSVNAVPVTEVPLTDRPCVQTAVKADVATRCDRLSSREDKVECFALIWQSRAGQLVASCGYAAYPLMALQHRLEGTTIVRITFDDQASLHGMDVYKSSGHSVLDQRALELIRLTSVDPPGSLRGESFSVRMPIVFKFGRPACVPGSSCGGGAAIGKPAPYGSEAW